MICRRLSFSPAGPMALEPARPRHLHDRHRSTPTAGPDAIFTPRFVEYVHDFVRTSAARGKAHEIQTYDAARRLQRQPLDCDDRPRLSWELGCRLLNVPSFILPTPSAAIASLLEYRDGIWLNATHTLMTTLLGLVTAVVFGAGLGVIVGGSPLLYRALNPLLIGSNSIPKASSYRSWCYGLELASYQRY